MGTVAISLGVGSVVRHRVDPAVAIVLTFLVLTLPVPTGAALIMWWAMRRFRRASHAGAIDSAQSDAALEAAELVGLGLAGGLSIAAAHRVALDHAPEPVRPALSSLLGSIDRTGVVEALGGDRGPLSGCSAVLAAASATGAPVLPALEAFVRQEHHRRHMAAVESARRLPIRLLIPLTLLVLPGFVLITVGPTLADSLARLSP